MLGDPELAVDLDLLMLFAVVVVVGGVSDRVEGGWVSRSSDGAWSRL